MTIAITGITGNMGQGALDALAQLQDIPKLKLLVRNPKRAKKLIKKHKALKDKVTVICGSMNDSDALDALVDGADMLINMAAVIPPRSDSSPSAALACNQTGVKMLLERAKKVDLPFIHVSTVAVYGHRTKDQPFARVSDPIFATPFDAYSTTKIRSEFDVMESGLSRWVVLRQSAMLHPQMLVQNISDGLMFHVNFDSPLEWVTAHDSGLLIANIVRRFCEGSTPAEFWRKCYNIAAGADCREYGMQTYDEGFAVIGGSTRDFFLPYYNAARNFHGVWYADGDELNDMFDFRRQNCADYWHEVFAAHPVFKLGKIVPKRIIRYFVVKRLLSHPNAPSYWAAHGDEARLTAYFGGREKYEELKKRTWADYPLPDPADIKTKSKNVTPVFYGFDVNKADEEIAADDVAAVAEAHGGRLLSDYTGDMYAPLDWENQDGQKFSACAYTVLRGGHWMSPSYDMFVWDYDRLAKKDKVLASVWQSSHGEDENNIYYFDGQTARVEKSV